MLPRPRAAAHPGGVAVLFVEYIVSATGAGRRARVLPSSASTPCLSLCHACLPCRRAPSC
jgi:hypothetical protein